MAPLLPKLRGHFAEFLNHSSPDRLSILYLTTCVGLGYGPNMNSLEAFLDSIGSPTSPKKGYASRLTHHAVPDLPSLRATRLHHNPISGSATFLCHPIAWLLPRQVPRTPNTTTTKGSNCVVWVVSIHDSPLARIFGYQNINWLSIDYACRPRLRSRLTLGRLA